MLIAKGTERSAATDRFVYQPIFLRTLEAASSTYPIPPLALHLYALPGRSSMAIRAGDDRRHASVFHNDDG